MAPSALLGISNQRRRKRRRDSKNSSRSESRNGPTRKKEQTRPRQKSPKNAQAYWYLFFYSVTHKQLLLPSNRFVLPKHLERVAEAGVAQQISNKEQRLDEERLDNGPAPRPPSPQHLQLQSERTHAVHETPSKKVSLRLPLILIIDRLRYLLPNRYFLYLI